MDIRKKLTQKNYSIIAKLYTEDLERNYENFNFIDDVLQLWKLHKLQIYPIVDLGSGPGTVIDYILKQHKKIHPLIAVDFNEYFCDRMNRKYIHSKNINVVHEEMVQFVKRQKALAIGAYICSYSLIHIPENEIDQLLQSIKRSLVKNGLLLISCFKGTTKGMEQERYQVLKDSRLVYNETLLCYMNYFTEDELRKRLKKAGMEIVKMEVVSKGKKDVDIPNEQIWVIAEKL
ncbi:class I SAM-dependent methyltransferase [Candidatus Roizmanbacteria bacterium]|nr:class I SAM-dependent methyltransferase [Candidatus Roizmanbacteria bacterium]